jgi:hypothetical protein
VLDFPKECVFQLPEDTRTPSMCLSAGNMPTLQSCATHECPNTPEVANSYLPISSARCVDRLSRVQIISNFLPVQKPYSISLLQNT